jgi:hypothetical protein
MKDKNLDKVSAEVLCILYTTSADDGPWPRATSTDLPQYLAAVKMKMS